MVEVRSQLTLMSMSQPNVDGGLVGGASLKPNDFFEMIKVAAASKLKGLKSSLKPPNLEAFFVPAGQGAKILGTGKLLARRGFCVRRVAGYLEFKD